MKKNPNNEKEKTTISNNTNQTPLFTGDRIKDTTVTEFEKLAEVANAIYNAIKSHKK